MNASDGTHPDPRVDIGLLTRAIYLPSLLFGIGQGAIIPIIVVTALDLGASPAVAVVLAAMQGLGVVVGTVPSGQIVSKVGEIRALHIGTAVVVLGLIGCALAPTQLLFGVSVLLTGVASVIWLLARQIFLIDTVPYHMRGRAMSVLGGTQRAGIAFGPFLGAGLMQFWGSDVVYWMHLVLAIAASVAVAHARKLVPDEHNTPTGDASLRATIRVIREHRHVMLTVGSSMLLAGAVRAGRQVLLPLWAASELNMDAATTSVVFGISGVLEVVWAYPGGAMIDRFGRRRISALSMATIGSAFVLLLLAPHTDAWLVVVAVLVGIGNGLSSGVLNTISADAAPATDRAQFLGAIRLWPAVGNFVGPALISGVAALAALGPGTAVMGGLGWAAAWAFLRWTPRGPADQAVRRGARPSR